VEDTDSELHSILCLYCKILEMEENHYVLLPQCWLITMMISLEARVGSYRQALLLKLNSRILVYSEPYTNSERSPQCRQQLAAVHWPEPINLLAPEFF
jgi:hypothetical protein